MPRRGAHWFERWSAVPAHISSQRIPAFARICGVSS